MPVYKDEDSNLWFVKYSYKNRIDGKFHGVTKRGFKTKREALAWEKEDRSKVRGILDMRFDSFAKIYLEKQSVRIKPSTLAVKKEMIEHHLLPYFGKLKVNDINPQDVMNWQTELMKIKKNGKGYSKSFLKTIHNQLSAILNFAVRYYGLPSNPAGMVGNMGTDKEIEVKFWTKKDYLKFREYVMEDPMYFYSFECLYWLGIREGELLALTVNDFDFENQKVDINKTYYVLNGEEYVTSPKTRKSIRTISVPKFLCDEMKDYLKMIYNPKNDSSLRIFPLTKSGLNRKIKAGAKEMNLPEIRVHDLRHSHCSLLIEMGYSAVAIAERLGHESVHITYRYAHLFPTVQNRMANDLDKLKK